MKFALQMSPSDFFTDLETPDASSRQREAAREKFLRSIIERDDELA